MVLQLPRNKTTDELPQKYKLTFNATIFPVACGVSAEMSQDSSSGVRQPAKAVTGTGALWVSADGYKLIWNTGISFCSVVFFCKGN